MVFIRKKRTPAESRYAVVGREALEVKWAVQDLRYSLLGPHFTLVTDHAPLQWMAKAKDCKTRVTRWFLALQDFSFEVRHRSGSQHGNVDGLSRMLSLWGAPLHVTTPPTGCSLPLGGGSCGRAGPVRLSAPSLQHLTVQPCCIPAQALPAPSLNQPPTSSPAVSHDQGHDERGWRYRQRRGKPRSRKVTHELSLPTAACSYVQTHNPTT